jgi:adenosylhomocysteine nucleosidase
VGAFPAEGAPNVDKTIVSDTVTVNGHVFRRGTLGGVDVIAGITGIGLVNAGDTTRALLEQFPITGVVMSAVAGSPLRIADVAVPERWQFQDGSSYPSSPEWLDVAREVASSGVVLPRCTTLPLDASAGTVCLPFQPAIFVGGFGQSADPYNNMAFPCQTGGIEDVFGCDPTPDTTAIPADGRGVIEPLPPFDPTMPISVDMETAAVAREAAAHGVRFIAFRSVSDGAEDPLGLPGFPAQFFAYYRLAARTASGATVAFLERLAANR